MSGRQLGPYWLESRLGRGGFGSVYRARDARLDRPVAVKVLDRTGDRELERFRREARALSALSHPNLVGVHDAGESAGLLYLVLELIEGEPLSERCDPQRLLPIDQVVRAIEGAARGLDHAHRNGILHRDVKPANLILESEQVRVVDFGLAFLLEPATADARLSQTGAWVGSPAYMAPEQAGGDDPDARTDVYGLGATLYHALCGRLPLEDASGSGPLMAIHRHVPPPPSRYRAGITPALDAICARCLEKDPSQRFPTARALADALASCAVEVESTRPPSRTPQVLGALAVVILFALAAALVTRPTAPTAAELVQQATAQPPGPAGDARTVALLLRARETSAGTPLEALVERELALQHYYRCRFADGLAAAERSLALDPSSLDAELLRAGCLGNLNREEEARVVRERVRDADPDGVCGLSAAADLAMGEDRLGAEGIPERVLELDPSRHDAWITIGYQRLANGDVAGALEAFERAKREEPRDPRPDVGLISALGYVDRLDEALLRVEALLDDLGADAPMAMVALRAKVHSARGENAQAERDLTRALEGQPDEIDFLFWRGIVRNQLHKREASEQDLRRAWALDPEEFDRVLDRSSTPDMAAQVRETIGER